MALIISACVILLLIFLGMSIPFCFLSGSLLFAILSGESVGSYTATAFYALNSFPLLAIPLFMIAGTLMEKSGIASTLVDLAEVMLRKVKGGMGASIPVVACFFGALSGSGTATVTVLASMMAPRLKALGWDKRYLGALIAASGPLGYMIPPNMNAIIFASVSEASVAALFLATLIPGLMWAGLYILINRIVYTKWYHPTTSLPTASDATDKSQPENKARSPEGGSVKSTRQVLRGALPAFMMPVIIMGGIYGGVMTATEAGAVGCLYAVIVGIFIYKRLTLKGIFRSFIETGSGLGAILIMFPMTLIFSRILVVHGVPAMVTALITAISTNKFVVIFVIDFIVLLAGFFLDAGILLLVFTPLLLPVATLVGISVTQLGVIMFVSVGIGTITPPMAIGLFIAGKMVDVTIKEMIEPLIPFFLFGGVPILFLVSYVPVVCTFLPRLILGAY